ncbi:MAG: T9SS type A sorting domain-containing protein, partial [Chitinophagaceae bacterium]
QDIDPGIGNSIPLRSDEVNRILIEVNGKVFASVTTPELGNEVWVGNIPAEIGLPLELLEFRGSLVNNDGLLQWKTENETNTENFILERSLDGQGYQPIGSVTAVNAAGIHHYNFTDPNIAVFETTIVYYRLKQIDADGSYTYSQIVTLALPLRKPSIVLYPNPVLTEMNLRIYTPQQEKIQWQLIDNIGRIIQYGRYDLSPGSTVVSEDISRISAGVYFIKIEGKNVQKVIKIIKR